MKVLIACEFSGVVRSCFLDKGHDAISCDLLASDLPGPHVQGNVIPLLSQPWDLVIAHPPCTYLCNSGVRWFKEQPERWEFLQAAAGFFKLCLNANAPRVAIENPIMNRHALSIIGRNYDFSVQPYEHGHPETKRTCFWVKNLPALKPTKVVKGRFPKVHYMSSNNALDRSKTYIGIARAMAEQWG